MALGEREQEVCKWIAKREAHMRADLGRYVAIPTGWNYTKGLEEFRGLMAERLRGLGAKVEEVAGDAKPGWLEYSGSREKKQGKDAAEVDVPPVLIGRREGETKKRVLIVGHLDTVHDPQGEFRELKVSADGGRGVGPGAVDMKGGIVIAMEALEALKACGVEVTWTVMLNSDEETGSYHSARTLRAEARKHDVGVVLEPATADGGLVIERMGSGTFQVEVFGKSAHVGRDFKSGVSAVLKLAEVMSAIGKLSDVERGRIVNIGPVVGGGATNVVADHAACWGNMRFADLKQAEELVRAIEGMATKGSGLPRVLVKASMNRPAKPETEGVRRLAEIARGVSEEVGLKMGFAKTGGVCDGNLLQENGLPTLDTLGVRGGNLHRDDEFAELSTIVARCQLLAVYLMRIAT